jgi:multimeric flavodoxin WrbA
MAIRLTALTTSFRKHANSTRLLDEALAGAREADAEVQVLDLARAHIGPCTACDSCVKTGRCVVAGDDFLGILDAVQASDRLLIASPIYYMSTPAQLKLFIDRTQCLYNLKYKIRTRLGPEELARRRGGVIAVCGSKKRFAFDGFDVTLSYLFDSLQMQFTEKQYVKGIDAAGDIEGRPAELVKARELGRRLAQD